MTAATSSRGEGGKGGNNMNTDCHCSDSLNDLAHLGREDLEVAWDATHRGFRIGEFRDLYGQPCSIQESSSAEFNAIWFGVGGCRMHLTVDHVRGLIDILRTWTESDEPLGPAATGSRGGRGEEAPDDQRA